MVFQNDLKDPLKVPQRSPKSPFYMGVFTCSILASIVTILLSKLAGNTQEYWANTLSRKHLQSLQVLWQYLRVLSRRIHPKFLKLERPKTEMLWESSPTLFLCSTVVCYEYGYRTLVWIFTFYSEQMMKIMYK